MGPTGITDAVTAVLGVADVELTRASNIPASRWCWVGLHRWSRWVDGEGGEVTNAMGLVTGHYHEQARICLGCGLREYREERV